MKARIRRVTAQIILQIWANGVPNKAMLSALRSSNSILNRNATVVWPALLSNMEKSDLSYNGMPTYAEKAVYAALHCYAVYQQGNTSQLVYEAASDGDEKGKELFSALTELRKTEDGQKALDRRVQVVLGNSNAESAINEIYHLVAIFKAKAPQRKIDFAQLGQDLYYMQLNRELARQVCLKWGQQYYQVFSDKDKSEKEK